MTRFMQKSFSIPVGDSAAYRDNWAETFGKKPAAKRKGAGNAGRKKRAKLMPANNPAGCSDAAATPGVPSQAGGEGTKR
jgi:hypothetical protein